MSESGPKRHTLRNAVLIVLAAVAVSVALWMSVPPPVPEPVPAPDQLAMSAPPAIDSLPVVAGVGGDFRLPASTGKDLALADLRGKVVLLNFGFTHCPDVCPLVLTRMGNALRELERQGVDMARVQPLFVTFDPARDTLAVLKEYVQYFHPSLIALRGDEAQTAALAKQYKVVYLQQNTGSAGGYVFQHSDFVYVLDPDGQVRLLVGSSDPDAAIVEAVRRLLRDADQAAKAKR